MSRPLLTAVLLLLCLCASTIRSEQSTVNFGQLLGSNLDAIRSLGSAPCNPTKDPCEYGREIGEKLSQMAKDIVILNNLPAVEGRKIFTEWINHLKAKYADKKCAQSSFGVAFAKFAKDYHPKPKKCDKPVPPKPIIKVIKVCSRKTLERIKDLESRLELQVAKTCKYKSLYKQEQLDFHLHSTKTLEEKMKLQQALRHFLKTLEVETLSKQVHKSDVHLHTCQLKVRKFEKHLEHLSHLEKTETNASKKIEIQKKIKHVTQKISHFKKKEHILMNKSIRVHKLKVKALKKELTVNHHEHHEHHEAHHTEEHHTVHKHVEHHEHSHKPAVVGCKPGHYISTTEIRQRIKVAKRSLLLKGRTCGFKEKVLQRIISFYEEMLTIEWKNIHTIEKEMGSTEDCNQLVCLKKRLIHRKEHALEIQNEIYSLNQRLDSHKLHDLEAAAQVSQELIDQLHLKLTTASDSDMLEVRASLKHEVANLKHVNRQKCKVEAHQNHLLELMEHKSHSLDKKLKLLDKQSHGSNDKCQKRLLDIEIHSIRRRIEIHHISIKRTVTIKHVHRYTKKVTILKKRLLKAKTHEERLKIRRELHKVQLHKSIYKKKVQHIKHIHTLHKRTLIIKKLHKRIDIIRKRILKTTDIKKRAELEKKLHVYTKRIKVHKRKVKIIRKKIVKIQKIIKKKRTVISHHHSSHKVIHHHEHHKIHHNEQHHEQHSSHKHEHTKHVVSHHKKIIKHHENIVKKHTKVIKHHEKVVRHHKKVIKEHISHKNHVSGEKHKHIEHHANVVKKHTDIVKKHQKIVRKHSKIIKKHKKIVKKHTKTIRKITKRRTKTIKKHKKVVKKHKKTVKRIKKTRKVTKKTRKITKKTRKVVKLKVIKKRKIASKVRKSSESKSVKVINKRVIKKRVIKKRVIKKKKIIKKKGHFRRKLKHGARRRLYEHQLREKTRLEFRHRKIIRKRVIVNRITRSMTNSTIIKRKKRKFVNKRRRFDEDDSHGNSTHFGIKDLGHHGKREKIDSHFTKTNSKVTMKYFHKVHKISSSSTSLISKHRKAKRFVSKRDYIDGDGKEGAAKISDSRKKPEPAPPAPAKKLTTQRKALSLARSESEDLDDAILMV